MGSSLGLGDVAFSGSISFSSLPQSMHSLISLAILSDRITIPCNSISQILINSQFLGQLLMRRDEVWSLIIPHAFPKSSVERVIVTYPSTPNLVQHEKAFLADLFIPLSRFRRDPCLNSFFSKITIQLDEDRKLSSKIKRKDRRRIMKISIDPSNYNRAP